MTDTTIPAHVLTLDARGTKRRRCAVCASNNVTRFAAVNAKGTNYQRRSFGDDARYVPDANGAPVFVCPDHNAVLINGRSEAGRGLVAHQTAATVARETSQETLGTDGAHAATTHAANTTYAWSAMTPDLFRIIADGARRATMGRSAFMHEAHGFALQDEFVNRVRDEYASTGRVPLTDETLRTLAFSVACATVSGALVDRESVYARASLDDVQETRAALATPEVYAPDCWEHEGRTFTDDDIAALAARFPTLAREAGL